MTDTTLLDRLRRVEDQIEIRQLLSRYCIHIDDRELDKVAQLFTRNGVFRSLDGVMNASGRDAIVTQYHGRFAVLGAGMHMTNDAIIELDPANPDRATGLITAHAELHRKGATQIAAMRYHDTYAREEGKWRFAERALEFFYYMNATDFPTALGELDRMRAYDKPAPADWPERGQGWLNYKPA